MKMKKIICSVLTAVLAFGAVSVIIPARVEAAYSEECASAAEYSSDEIKAIVNTALTYGQPGATAKVEIDGVEQTVSLAFTTAEECLAYELSCGYLDQANSADKAYSIYVNRYTGMVYYVNNLTGQILLSNPFDVGLSPDLETRKHLSSQIQVVFSTKDKKYNGEKYYSTEWAAMFSQIETNRIANGIRVSYALGDTTQRFFYPGRLSQATFEDLFIHTMVDEFVGLLEEYCGEAYPDVNFSFFENENYVSELYGCLNTQNSKDNPGLKSYFNDMQVLYAKVYKKTAAEYKKLQALSTSILQLCSAYTVVNPSQYADNERYQAKYDAMIEKYYSDPSLEIYQTHAPFYVTSNDNAVDATKRAIAEILLKYAGNYTFAMMYAEEKAFGYVNNQKQKPVFHCALEYTFNTDGSLSVRLPANSITFDEAAYLLDEVIPLQYFGAGNMSEEGYLFFPDGSGTIINFEDFNNIVIKGDSYVFGLDYCYSTIKNITGARHAQVTMPVFGVVNNVKANAATVATYGADVAKNGYFAILEEGASLAHMNYEASDGAHKYAYAYASYTPYPADEYDLSVSGGSGSYPVVSDSKYNGSYVTRYAMLNDETIGDTAYGAGNYYPSSYQGMANYYNNYLVNNGTLKALEDLNENLPLYIEALGCMQITTKVLSFPVTESIALTSFDDVATMYEEFSNVKAKYEALAAEYDEMAAEEADEVIAASYAATAEKYRDLSATAKDIKNINFRLTGFANGGMYFTYPTKVHWERVLGGKKGLLSLKNVAAEKSQGGANFGIYPDFDFMYINNTKAFDGISSKGNVSRLVDNRYASKQTYDSVIHKFFSDFTMVISPDALDRLYSIFSKKYAKFDMSTLSVSTMGSDLNSNFDEEASTNRDDAQGYVVDLLARMTNDGYSLMMDDGNIYTVRYAAHLLNAATDSSHFSYASYPIPFVGMVLHGYVNYSGSPINYSGSLRYEMLRSIESGASLYYILCYENTSFMKDDEELCKYYGVDYANWYDSIVASYAELNEAIGGLQSWRITGHEILLGERVIEENETAANYVTLKNEIVSMLDRQIADAVDAGFDALRLEGSASVGKALKVSIDRTALMAQFASILGLEVADVDEGDFAEKIDAVIAKYEAEYPGKDAGDYVVAFDAVEYESAYSFLTLSEAKDKDYVYTDYTSDVNNIVLVTYTNGTDSVRFLLNYNIYSVTVRLDGEVYTVEKYGYAKIQ